MRAPRPYTPEPVDPEEVSPSGPLRAFKQAGLVLLCAAWVCMGLVGHDPWKTEDATSIGVASEMASRGDLVVPTLAGETYLARPPLIYISGALAIKALSPPLERHNAARLIAGVALALILLVTAQASRELNGRALRWLPVLILIGSVGFWDRAHVLSPELGDTAGVAVALYGFALALRRPIAGGIVLGVGIAISFLSRGLLGPAWIVVSALLLPLIDQPWRTRAYGLTLLVALSVAAPLALSWPLALHMRDPALFAQWWKGETLANYFAFFGSGADFAPGYFLKNLLWFAWPSLPLMLWMFWTRGRGFNGGLKDPGVQVPAVMSIVILASLIVLPDPKLANAIPLLVPFALLAALEVDSLKRGFSGALDWFGILTFGLLAMLAWGFWIDAYLRGMSPRVAQLFRDAEAGFRTSFHLGAMLSAVLLTLLWIMLVRPARRSNRRAILNWAAGVTLIWGLVTTIWLPYIDSRRTYRNVVENAAMHMPRSGCVASRDMGEPQRALFYYFSGVATVREDIEPKHDCPALLVQYSRLATLPPPPSGWTQAWDGHRRGDETERIVLYVRKSS
jgi:4-amino-4-deoxy-L-arabinose transferase-like glycosyltransferase